MAVNYKNWAIYGFVIGVVLPFITGFIAKNLLTSLTVQFSVLPSTTVSPGIPSSTTGFFLALTSNAASLPVYVLSGIGSLIFVLIGVSLYSWINKPVSRSAFARMFYVLVYASLGLAAFTFWQEGAIALFPVIFVALINSAVISGIAWALDKFDLVKIPSI